MSEPVPGPRRAPWRATTFLLAALALVQAAALPPETALRRFQAEYVRPVALAVHTQGPVWIAQARRALERRLGLDAPQSEDRPLARR